MYVYPAAPCGPPGCRGLCMSSSQSAHCLLSGWVGPVCCISYGPLHCPPHIPQGGWSITITTPSPLAGGGGTTGPRDIYIYIYIHDNIIYIYIYIRRPLVGHQAAEDFACRPVHLLIACCQVPQPYHLTTDFVTLILGICVQYTVGTRTGLLLPT